LRPFSEPTRISVIVRHSGAGEPVCPDCLNIARRSTDYWKEVWQATETTSPGSFFPCLNSPILPVLRPGVLAALPQPGYDRNHRSLRPDRRGRRSSKNGSVILLSH